MDVRRLSSAVGFEDVCLGLGALAVGLGVGYQLGIGYGLAAFGALSVAYGVWITERRQ